MNLAGYWILYLFPLLTVLSSVWAGDYLLTPVLVIVAFPLLDMLLGKDPGNPSRAENRQLLAQPFFRYILYLYVPVQLGMVLWSCYQVSHQPLSALESFCLLISIGIVTSSLAINVAHELCHRSPALEQALAKTLLFTVCYMHFHIEHRLGHHLRVGTPEDPATARLGESVYGFFLRSVIGSYKSAWRIETDRLERKGRGLVSLDNQMIWFTALPLAFGLFLLSIWGWKAGLFFVLQSLLAVLTLETVNYFEHYGLERRRLPSGKYERVGIQHSWNSSHLLSNYFLLKLPRHADHHVHPGRRYQLLRTFEQSPQLPSGYVGMIILSLLPPLWRRVMDPRVEAWRTAHGLENPPHPATEELRLEDPCLS
ncbi:MAG: alkane 1-monooxygenase [Candidatus Sericytochromatia bacterium]